MKAQTVSIVVIAWKNKKFLQRCLESLDDQTLTALEVIVLDNNSTEGGLGDLSLGLHALQIQYKHLDGNKGFALANNIGARMAKGKYLALLNADAYPEPVWLENLMRAAEAHQEYSCFASRQIQANAPTLLDGTGDSYHISGLAWRKNYNMPAPRYGLNEEEVFSPCGAAALYLREYFLQAGGFDEDYFAYFEDVDLGFRLRLSGEKCLYVPEAVVHHVGSASTEKSSDFSVYYGYRNLIWTFIKNMPAPLFWLFLPFHVSTVLFFALYLTIRGQGRVITKAILDAINGLPIVLKKRNEIQKNVKIKTRDLLKVMSTGPLEPYLEFIERNKSK